jgi:hypothetical protein
MTRFDGYRLLACPLCHTVHAKANLVSFNLMAHENWSDGRSVHSLFDHRQGLRKCTGCQGFFLETEAIDQGRISSLEAEQHVAPYEVDIPAFLRRDADGERQTPADGGAALTSRQSSSWLGRLLSWRHRPAQAQAAPVLDAKPSGAADEARPRVARLQSVYDCDLATILERKDRYSDALILAARQLYWMYLNDPYRDTARGLIKQGQDPTVAYRPTELQIDNMRSLLALMEEQPADYRDTTRAELYRELGEFDRAVSLLQQYEASDREAATIMQAAAAGISAPVRIRYAHQRLS